MKETINANSNRETAKNKNGFWTAEASPTRYASFSAGCKLLICSLLFIESLNKNMAPTAGAIAVPKELKAWDKFNRLEAVSSDPRTAT